MNLTVCAGWAFLQLALPAHHNIQCQMLHMLDVAKEVRSPTSPASSFRALWMTCQ